MTLRIRFWSYFRDLAGGADHSLTLPDGASLGDVLGVIEAKFPAWKPFRPSTLVAVGLEYQPLDYRVQPGDEISLFPPVQGG